jgi:hypothetical protein
MPPGHSVAIASWPCLWPVAACKVFSNCSSSSRSVSDSDAMARNTSARVVPAPVPVGIASWYSGVCVSVMSVLAGSGCRAVRWLPVLVFASWLSVSVCRLPVPALVRRFRPNAAPAPSSASAIRPDASDAIHPVAAPCPATTWPLAIAMPVSPSGFSRIFRPSAALFAALFLRTALFLRKTGSLNSPDSTRLDEPDQPRQKQHCASRKKWRRDLHLT